VTIRRVNEAWVEKAKQEAVWLKVSMNQVLVDALRCAAARMPSR